jgi:predicted CXXCH cytochrome family protein
MNRAVSFWVVILFYAFFNEAELTAQSNFVIPRNPGSGFDHLFFAGTKSCKRCHLPESPDTGADIWNSIMNVQRRSVIYSGEKKDDILHRQLTAGFRAPSGSSIQCLSCHDGLVASGISSLAGTTFTEGYKCSPENEDAGKFCSIFDRHHPVSIDYASARAAGRMPLQSESTDLASVFCDTAAYSCLRGPVKTTGRLLENGRVECSSCHVIHSTALHNLRISNKESLLCLACHIR